MGLALGRIGLARDDFAALLPEEFIAVCESWRAGQEDSTKGAWERMRLLATISIQPHVKSKLTPQKLLPLPWDNKRPQRTDAPKLTKEQQHKRFKELLHRLGED